MRELNTTVITQAVAENLQKIQFHIRPDVERALTQAVEKEASPLGRQALELLLESAKHAGAGVYPLCQDTGLTVLFVELGQDLHIAGNSLEEALQAGVRQASQNSRLRNSVLAHPIRRNNTQDNTPAMIHYQVTTGASLKITLMAKGGGCDNASRLGMLTPSEGRRGVETFVIETVRAQGAMACPPLIIGVGLGGNFETVPLLAKKALLRPVGEPSSDPEAAAMEHEILKHVNALGIGPQGWGGTQTALSVAIETAPCHIASLPVAINLECHSHRVAEVIL
jgi:fumarate hydratase subunit alpha